MHRPAGVEWDRQIDVAPMLRRTESARCRQCEAVGPRRSTHPGPAFAICQVARRVHFSTPSARSSTVGTQQYGTRCTWGEPDWVALLLPSDGTRGDPSTCHGLLGRGRIVEACATASRKC